MYHIYVMYYFSSSKNAYPTFSKKRMIFRECVSDLDANLLCQCGSLFVRHSFVRSSLTKPVSCVCIFSSIVHWLGNAKKILTMFLPKGKITQNLLLQAIKVLHGRTFGQKTASNDKKTFIFCRYVKGS